MKIPEKLKKGDKIGLISTARKVSRSEIAHAVNIFKSWDLNIEFIESGAEEIALDDNVVDTALLTYTLCSIRYPDLALKEIRRVLRENGKLVYCEHGVAPDRGVKNVQNIMNYFYPYLAGGCNLNRDIPDLIRKNGFKLGDIETMYLPGTPKWSGYNYWGVAH